MLEPTILCVEDEASDVLLLELALKKAQITNPLNAVENGQEAVAYLKGVGKYADRNQYPIPCLILLDLHLPHMSGIEVLQWIRKQPALASLTVVIYTSDSHDGMAATQQLGANDYMVKPSGFDKLVSAVQTLKERWLPIS